MARDESPPPVSGSGQGGGGALDIDNIENTAKRDKEEMGRG